ncbi:uncharacterized protein [Pseudochaenichthys georgianus]|uniref:uncharacterized protein n=1 Tax=Pseudochaenichthys georgianus TaxID=52239 RepID=UPI0039C396E7
MGMETARRPVEEPPGTSDDIDSALEGPSKGMETARRPVEEPPGTSDDIDSALEGPSKALNTNADENDKEPGRRGDMHEPPESLENAVERNPRRMQKQKWSPKEVAAVFRHFNAHIAKGKLATMIECRQCQAAEHPILAGRSLQNIRDFVRNQGTTRKKKALLQKR